MEWFSLAIFGLLIVVSPGADFVLVFKNSSLSGRKAGLLTALGIGLGVCVHITYSMIGISHLVSHNHLMLSIVKYAGAAYLIYLGVSGLMSTRLNLSSEPAQLNQQGGNLLQGFLCNALNPKTMLFFLSVFSQLLAAPTSNQAFVAAYGIYLALLHTAWFALVAYLMTSERMAEWLGKFGHRINQTCGLGLITFGIVLSTSA